MQTKGELLQIKSQIDAKGLKRRWIAAKLAVSEPMFSLYLKGQRSLDPNKIQLLKQLLGL